MIPKIIHYSWINKDRNAPLPEKAERCISSWKKYCPDYEFKLWNQDTFDFENTVYVKQTYDLGLMGYCPDYIRLWALYNFGGIYLDADVLLEKPLDGLLDNECFFGWEHEDYQCKFLGTAVIGSEKGNEIIKSLLDEYEKPFITENGDALMNIQSNSRFKSILKEKYNTVDISTIAGLKIYDETVLYGATKKTDRTICSHLTEGSWVRSVDFILPTYNNEETVEKCIVSMLPILRKKNFDLMIVDGGSSDKTVEICERYAKKYNNISLIKKENTTCFAECVNLGLLRVTGSKMVIIDPKKTFNLSSLKQICKTTGDVTIYGQQETDLKYRDCIEGDLNYSWVILDGSIKRKLNFFFEGYFDGVEYYKFLLNAVTHGLSVKTANIKLYNEKQTKEAVPSDVIAKMKHVYDDPCKGDLTAVIAFKDEKSEIERTVVSLKYTAKNINILLIDDCSEENYDYKSIAECFGCMYYRTKKRLGSAGSKHLGGMISPTEYFCFFDGHMRVYVDGWDEKLINWLKKEPDAIISSRTVIMNIENGFVVNENGKRMGIEGTSACCRIEWMEGRKPFNPIWTNKFIDEDDSNELSPCACVMGACYATTKTHWQKINGLDGLYVYGLEEPYMSLKTWLSGGKCYVTKHWGVGHLYRKKFPFQMDAEANDVNRTFLVHFFGETVFDITKNMNMIKERCGEEFFDKVQSKFDLVKCLSLKKEFKKIKVHDIKWFNDEINNKVSP